MLLFNTKYCCQCFSKKVTCSYKLVLILYSRELDLIVKDFVISLQLFRLLNARCDLFGYTIHNVYVLCY